MKKKHISTALFIASSSFASIATATTTIDLQDVEAGTTGINNIWQRNTVTIPNVGTFPNVLQHVTNPYSKTSSDGTGAVTLSPIIDFNDDAHIHISGGDGDPSTATTPFIHGDVGGVFIAGSGIYDTFSFQSMDVLHSVLKSTDPEIAHQNATLTVRGFLGGTNNMLTGTTEIDDPTTPGIDESIHLLYKGGEQVATAIINDDFEGTFNFLATDAGFGEVDYVEFFFTDFYRFKPSSLGNDGLDFAFDNIVIGEAGVSAVPVPAAAWLFGTGLVGLVSLGKRKQKVLTT